jgi:hypothetical protein
MNERRDIMKSMNNDFINNLLKLLKVDIANVNCTGILF